MNSTKICKLKNTITAGLRSGEVRLFDVRSRENASTELFGSRFSKKDDGVSCGIQDQKKRNVHSAVTHLQVVSEWEMLVGTSAGEVCHSLATGML